MDLQKLFRRVAWTGATSVVAFATGAAVDPAPAGAHCGGHSGSCGITDSVTGGYCNHPYYMDVHSTWYNDCSGTCYNGGTEGCCDSPEACAEAPCKPGGCGGPCQYIGTYEEWSGMTC